MKTKFALAVSLLSVASFASAEEVKELSLDASGLKSLEVDAGAGSLEIVGISSGNTIEVTATIDGYEKGEYILELTERRGRAVLVAKNEEKNGVNWRIGERYIDLDVKVPASMALDIDDGSGNMSVKDIEADVRIDDGSGDILVSNVKGDVNIDDGSGSLTVKDINGSVEVEDGSGDMDIENITGDVRVDDGSGSIGIYDVEGKVAVEDGSGNIRVDGAGSFELIDDGSGGLKYSNIAGAIDVPHESRRKHRRGKH